MGAKKLYEEQLMKIVSSLPEEKLLLLVKQAEILYNEDEKLTTAKLKLNEALSKARRILKNYDGSTEAFAKRKAEEKLLDF